MNVYIYQIDTVTGEVTNLGMFYGENYARAAIEKILKLPIAEKNKRYDYVVTQSGIISNNKEVFI